MEIIFDRFSGVGRYSCIFIVFFTEHVTKIIYDWLGSPVRVVFGAKRSLTQFPQLYPSSGLRYTFILYIYVCVCIIVVRCACDRVCMVEDVNQTRTKSMAVMPYTLPSAAPFRSHCKCEGDVSYWSPPPPWWWKIRVRNVKKENRPHVSFAKSPPSTPLTRTDQSYLWPPTIVWGRLMCNVRTRTYIILYMYKRITYT